MIKLSSISLSLLILFQSSGIGLVDITQIDEFIEHARFHSKQYGDNVLVFVSKHYGALKTEHNEEHQEEKKDHEQLPFQQHSQSLSISVFVLTDKTDEFKPFELHSFKKHAFYYQEPSSHLYLEAFFHPPRHS
ncbi:MAG: hypothetical protein VW080_05615 [Flavobacteriaceae bacterium]